MPRIIKPLLVFFREHSPTHDMDMNVSKLTEYDRLVFMNMQPWDSWAAAKRFITKHRYADGFYTHAVIINDDVIFDVDTLDLMIERVRAYNYPVLVADATDDATNGRLHYYQTIKYPPPSKDRNGRSITFHDGSNNGLSPIVKVSWTRCQLMILRSDLIVNTLSFRNDSIYNNITDSEGIDPSTVIANELHDANIDQYIDTQSIVQIKDESVVGHYYVTPTWNCYMAKKGVDLNIWQVNMAPVPQF